MYGSHDQFKAESRVKVISDRVTPRNNQETKNEEARNFNVVRRRNNGLALCLHPSAGFPFT